MFAEYSDTEGDKSLYSLHMSIWQVHDRATAQKSTSRIVPAGYCYVCCMLGGADVAGLVP